MCPQPPTHHLHSPFVLKQPLEYCFLQLPCINQIIWQGRWIFIWRSSPSMLMSLWVLLHTAGWRKESAGGGGEEKDAESCRPPIRVPLLSAGRRIVIFFPKWVIIPLFLRNCSIWLSLSRGSFLEINMLCVSHRQKHLAGLVYCV